MSNLVGEACKLVLIWHTEVPIFGRVRTSSVPVLSLAYSRD
jgi:hypothetical protein